MPQENDLVEWEIRFSYLEDNLLQVNKTMVEQQQRIELLEEKNRQLIARVKELMDQNDQDLQNNPPPHY
ncbi:MAG: SlyX family protein [Spirochaetaceae bacterium]|nr:SlyX family protein [Spirochaetaceae bacterium]